MATPNPGWMGLQQIIGANVRRLRVLAGLTQDALAAAARLDRGNLSELENGLLDPRISTLIRIADVLKVPVSELFNSG